MGLNSFWQEDVFITLQSINHQVKLIDVNPYYIINMDCTLSIHLIPLDNNFIPAELLDLQEEYRQQGKQLIQLWEDVWLAKSEQVLSRFKSFLGLNKSFHGRKAKLKELSLLEVKEFLANYHLQGYVKAKYNFGLLSGDEIIAVASFSEARPMKSRGEGYKSAELVRFASKDGLTIVGGLSKLIKHFLKDRSINDLMTYADRDWSLGNGYDKLGFTCLKSTAPIYMYVNTQTLIRYAPHRLPKEIVKAFKDQKLLILDDFLASNGYLKVFNTGNLKYILYL